MDPGIDPSVPNTGLFIHGIGGTKVTIIVITSAVLLLTIVAIVLAVLYRKHKKQNKTTKLVHLVDSAKAIITNKKRVTAALTAIALLVSAGTFIALAKNAVNATDADEQAEGADGSSLTVDVTSEELTIEVVDEPVFAVLPVDVTVEEATQAGYTLTAYTDSTNLVSTTDESKVIPMVAVDEGELVALTDNTYGLALDEKPTTKDAEVYMPLSIDSDTPTILKATDYVETEANDTTTIYYGFYITPDVTYGTYTGTNINYNVEPHYITNLSFNGNGNDGGVDMEGMTIIAGDTITLPENTFAKEGYNFIGWNTVAEPTEQDSGEAYTDQAEYTAPATSQYLTLYAQWEEDALYMQNVSEWGSSLEIGDEVIAVDSRDGKEYYVARLADNNIWMTQNLDLNIEAGRTYTSADTDLANSTIGTTWVPTSSEATYPTGTTTWNSSTTTPESYDPGVYYWNGVLMDNKVTCEEYGGIWYEPGYRPSYCDGANPTTADGNSHYHIGNYYNWTAAVAMSDSSSYTTQYTDVNQSICPAGWRLPICEGDKSYQNLVNVQSLTAGTSGNIQNTPTYFVYGGYWNGYSYVVGSGGYYWSSIVHYNGSYDLYFDIASTLNPSASAYRTYGTLLRCVAR